MKAALHDDRQGGCFIAIVVIIIIVIFNSIGAGHGLVRLVAALCPPRILFGGPRRLEAGIVLARGAIPGDAPPSTAVPPGLGRRSFGKELAILGEDLLR